MSANKLREHAQEHSFDAVTARPKPIADDFARDEADVGLSVDPEDLGGWALRSAMQEDVAHSRGHSEPLSITDAPPSDAALPGPNFNSIDGIWGQSVDAALAAGGVDATRASGPVDSDDDSGERPYAYFDESLPEIDYREDRVVDASLMDTPTGEDIETFEPRIRDDANESRLSETEAHELDSEQDAERTTTNSGFYRVPSPPPTAAKPRKPAKKRKASKAPKAAASVKTKASGSAKAKASGSAKAKASGSAKAKASGSAKAKASRSAKATVSKRSSAKKPRKVTKKRKAAKAAAPKRRKTTAKRSKSRR